MSKRKVLNAGISHALLPVSGDCVVLAESFFKDVFRWERDDAAREARISMGSLCFKNPKDGKKAVVLPFYKKLPCSGCALILECETVEVVNEIMDEAKSWEKKTQTRVDISHLPGGILLSVSGVFFFSILLFHA
ncbi:MAG TPA: hypothetical protein DCX32_02300 [Candidatus Moranbacteria bacterium]|nr:hypothetical protein [Candidatus Moranbacteria bacterium]